MYRENHAIVLQIVMARFTDGRHTRHGFSIRNNIGGLTSFPKEWDMLRPMALFEVTRNVLGAWAMKC